MLEKIKNEYNENQIIIIYIEIVFWRGCVIEILY